MTRIPRDEAPRMPKIPSDVAERGRHVADSNTDSHDGDLGRRARTGTVERRTPGRKAMEVFRHQPDSHGPGFTPRSESPDTDG